jgi:hypothetical protein
MGIHHFRDGDIGGGIKALEKLVTLVAQVRFDLKS